MTWQPNVTTHALFSIYNTRTPPLLGLNGFSRRQDAHELFHVLTSTLEEERERQPRVTHLFDMETLEVQDSLLVHKAVCVLFKGV